MNIRRFGVTAACVALVGCASSSLPRGARWVGGGLKIAYETPADGTVILMERTTGRIVATESLPEGRSFTFAPDHQNYSEVLFRMFGSTNSWDPADVLVVPTNTYFQLYFVPVKAKKK